MRLVSMERLTDEMDLARTLYDGRGMLILPVGSKLTTHKNQLSNFNIEYLHVEDKLSDGIVMSQLLSDDTRIEIHDTMKRLKTVYKPVDDPKKTTFFDVPFTKLAKKMAEDIGSSKDVMIDITELVVNGVFDFDHDLNVGILSALIGRAFGMSRDNIQYLAMGGFLHDIGTLALSDKVRAKMSTKMVLDQVDIEEYRQYPLMGYDMVKHNNALNLMTKSAVLQHKEKFDGTGFPGRKQGDEITMAGKIVAIANAFEKLYFGRDPELGKLKIFDIVRYMLQNAGKLFDPAVASVFVKNLIIFPNGTTVRLNDGSVGIVESQTPGQIARPVVRIIAGKDSWYPADLTQGKLVIEDVLDL